MPASASAQALAPEQLLEAALRSPTVSTVSLARNEGLDIRRCREHLGWRDARIVVDLQREDRTGELAEALATRVVPHEPIPSSDAARNRGLEAATGDGIPSTVRCTLLAPSASIPMLSPGACSPATVDDGPKRATESNIAVGRRLCVSRS